MDNLLVGKQLIRSIAFSQNKYRGVAAYLNDIAIALPRQLAGHARSLDCGERCWIFVCSALNQVCPHPSTLPVYLSTCPPQPRVAKAGDAHILSSSTKLGRSGPVLSGKPEYRPIYSATSDHEAFSNAVGAQVM